MPPEDTKGHRERLRQRFLNAGAEALHDYELLELILAGAIPRKDVKPIAKALIRHFGSFTKVLSADLDELLKMEGVGDSAAFALKLAHGTTVVFHKHGLKRTKFRTTADVLDYLYVRLSDLPHEVFYVIYLDTKNGIIRSEELFRGTVNSSTVYPSEVMKHALKYGATSIIVAHNHPSGDATPSTDDHILTVELFSAAKTVNIQLIDHVVIGNDEHFSFKDAGEL